MLFIVYEYAACLVVASISGTLLFTVTSTCVMLWGAGGITWQWWRELASVPHWRMERWTAEHRVP
jgi:hypothetical protein